MTVYYDHLETPLGTIEITASEQQVTSIHFAETLQARRPNSVSAKVSRQLQEYFVGDRERFDLPLGAEGTDFQKRVWAELSNINFGETCSYGDIAKKIDNPKGMRAVGLANGKNPLTIVVPCHRVIGANGKLTGYASGTQRKAWLLNHEARSLF